MGVNMKFEMVMEFVDDAPRGRRRLTAADRSVEPDPPLPHAARSRAPAMTRTTAPLLNRLPVPHAQTAWEWG